MLQRRVRLNGLRMDTREHAHAHIKRRMRFPDYYGNNLDALHDCLGEIGDPCVIVLRHCGRLRESLGAYGDRLLNVFADAARSNPALQVVIRDRF